MNGPLVTSTCELNQTVDNRETPQMKCQLNTWISVMDLMLSESSVSSQDSSEVTKLLLESVHEMVYSKIGWP